MRSARVTAAAVAISAALIVGLTPAAASAQSSAPFEWRGMVLQGNTIEIKGVNGDVTAEPGSGGEVEVRAIRRGRKNNPEDVQIEVVQHGEGVTICAVYPSTDGRPNECKPGEGGRMNVQNNDVSVTFTVSVPAGCPVRWQDRQRRHRGQGAGRRCITGDGQRLRQFLDVVLRRRNNGERFDYRRTWQQRVVGRSQFLDRQRKHYAGPAERRQHRSSRHDSQRRDHHRLPHHRSRPRQPSIVERHDRWRRAHPRTGNCEREREATAPMMMI